MPGAVLHPFTGTLLGPSGGLLWHWRALTGRRRTAATRHGIAHWLGRWQPPCTDLVIVGPSAGWMLPREFLLRFKRIVAFDLDPSARWLFGLAHGLRLWQHGIELQWRSQDFTQGLATVLQARPAAAVLFCNVLGQLSLERDDHAEVLARLPHQLKQHHWASFHDAYSGRIDPQRPPLRPDFTLNRALQPDDLRRLGCSGTWHDHGTGSVFGAGVTRHILPWMITADRMHWLEAGCVSPASPVDGVRP